MRLLPDQEHRLTQALEIDHAYIANLWSGNFRARRLLCPSSLAPPQQQAERSQQDAH